MWIFFLFIESHEEYWWSCQWWRGMLARNNLRMDHLTIMGWYGGRWQSCIKPIIYIDLQFVMKPDETGQGYTQQRSCCSTHLWQVYAYEIISLFLTIQPVIMIQSWGGQRVMVSQVQWYIWLVFSTRIPDLLEIQIDIFLP